MSSLRRIQALVTELQAELEHAQIAAGQERLVTGASPTGRTPAASLKPISPIAGGAADGTGGGSHRGLHSPPPLRKQSSAEDDLALRPALYPHIPQRRSDVIERLRQQTEDVDVADALRLRSFEGWYNLCLFLLIFSLVYICGNSVARRGLRITLDDFTCPEVRRDGLHMMAILSTATAVSCLVFALVKAHIHGYISPTVLGCLYFLVQLVLLVFPIVAVVNLPMAPLPSMTTAMVQVVLMLKSHSFFATNLLLLAGCSKNGCDTEPKPDAPSTSSSGSGSGSGGGLRRRGKKGTTTAKDTTTTTTNDEDSTPTTSTPAASLARLKRKTTFTAFVYFLMVPCLVYELHFPVVAYIRWGYVTRKALEASVCFFLQYFLLRQFILPVFTGPSPGVVVSMLKLAMPSFATWLLGFYGLFHCLLNISAELTQFADREFYKAWWNASTLDSFWRLWNIPVHEFALRHAYLESMHYGKVSKQTATFSTFLLSAVLHELVFSVGIKRLHYAFFLGMLMQIPLIIGSRRLRGTRRGNLAMWLSLYVGQPCLLVLYLGMYFQTHDEFFCVPA